jgi:multiple sugar transport system substrate-binding protein
MPFMLGIQEIYFRKRRSRKGRHFDRAAEDLEGSPRSRQAEVKAKTGAYGLLFPAGVSWGGGAFDEGFQHLIVGSKTPQIVDADGKLDLNGEGVKDVFGVYKELIDKDLMPTSRCSGLSPGSCRSTDVPAGQAGGDHLRLVVLHFRLGPREQEPDP